MVNPFLLLTDGLVHGTGGRSISVSAGEFFSRFVGEMGGLLEAKDYLAIVIDWRVLVVAGVLVGFGLYLKSKPMLLLVFSVYGLAATYHFAIGPDRGEEAMIRNVDNIVILVVGLLLIALVVVYFTLIRSD